MVTLETQNTLTALRYDGNIIPGEEYFELGLVPSDEILITQFTIYKFIMDNWKSKIPMLIYFFSLFLAYFISLIIILFGQLNESNIYDKRSISLDIGILTMASFMFWYFYQPINNQENIKKSYKRYLLITFIPSISCILTLFLLETAPFHTNFAGIPTWPWYTWLSCIIITGGCLIYAISSWIYRYRRNERILTNNLSIDRPNDPELNRIVNHVGIIMIKSFLLNMFIRLLLCIIWIILAFLFSGVINDFYLHHMILFSILAIIFNRPRTLHLFFIGVALHGLVSYDFPKYLIHID